ncbi:MAG: hypothetical protein OEM04_07120 [Flavobacteriaceae bacterium]|nr:hypothetical protein [Flavobacteriaceae bacterium]
MKKLLILAIALFTLNVSATEKPVKPTDALRTEIIDLLGPNCPEDLSKNECTIDVIFTVNSESEIIVLSVDSSNDLAESFVKNKLNYKKVNYESHEVGELFLLPVTFKKS